MLWWNSSLGGWLFSRRAQYYYVNNIQATICAVWLVKYMSINLKSVQFHQCKKVNLSTKWLSVLKMIDSSYIELGQYHGGQTLHEDWKSLPKFQYNYVPQQSKAQSSTKITKLIKAK